MRILLVAVRLFILGELVVIFFLGREGLLFVWLLVRRREVLPVFAHQLRDLGEGEIPPFELLAHLVGEDHIGRGRSLGGAVVRLGVPPVFPFGAMGGAICVLAFRLEPTQLLFLCRSILRRGMARRCQCSIRGNASGIGNLALKLSAVAEFHTQRIEVGFGDVEDGFPSIKTLLEEVVEVVRDTQLREYISQVSHTVDRRWKSSRAFFSQAALDLRRASQGEQSESGLLLHGCPDRTSYSVPDDLIVFVTAGISPSRPQAGFRDAGCGRGMGV